MTDKSAEALARAERAEARAAVAERINLEIMRGQERAEAEANSLRNTIDNMRMMNIKLTLEAAGKVLAAQAQRDAMREALEPFVTTAEQFGNWDDNERVNVSIKLSHLRKARAALAPSPVGEGS